MASFPSDLTDCPVCFEPYSSTKGDNIPLCLPPPCGHTFCAACCGKLFAGKEPCPTCRRPMNVRSIDDLSRDYTMISFLDAPASPQSAKPSPSLGAAEEEDISLPSVEAVKNVKCANHDEGCTREASVYCKECAVCLCEECAAASHKVGFMKSHKLGPMSERQVRCPVHSDQICDLVVAGENKQVICFKCHQYGKFKNKEARQIEVVSAELIVELKEQLRAVSSMLNALTTQQSSLKNNVQSIRDNTAACREQLQNSFQQIEEMIAAEKRKQLLKVDEFEQAQVQAAEEQVQVNFERTASMVVLEEKIKLLTSGRSDKVTLVLSFADLRAEMKTQEASVTQLLNQAGTSVLSLRQDVEAVRRQLTAFTSLTIETNAPAPMTFTGFALPVSSPEEREAKALADSGTINSPVMSNDRTPLIDAAYKNKLGMVKALLKFGADVNAKDGDGITSLMVASLRSSVEVVRVLLAVEGIDVNAKDRDGDTALMKACIRNGVEVVRALLAVEGIDVNAKGEHGGTALMEACHNNRVEVVRALLAVEGIDVNAQTIDGRTALSWASNPEIQALLRSAGAR